MAAAESADHDSDPILSHDRVLWSILLNLISKRPPSPRLINKVLKSVRRCVARMVGPSPKYWMD